MTHTKDALSNSIKLSSREKAIVTDETARAIIAAETSLREEKTERLKLLRLEREAAEVGDGGKRRKSSKDH
jgi:uncharacterized membrane-anchored protein